jgi:hypothetical protein
MVSLLCSRGSVAGQGGLHDLPHVETVENGSFELVQQALITGLEPGVNEICSRFSADEDVRVPGAHVKPPALPSSKVAAATAG